MIFETERLSIRKVKSEDLEALHEMHSNPNVMRYTGDTVKTLKEDEQNLRHIQACYTTPGNDFWVWAVIRKSDHAFIGTCALLKSSPQHENEVPEDEIGYRLSERHWGNGYASEITPALIRYVFDHFGKPELIAEVDELNVASVKVLEKYMNFETVYYNPQYKSNDRKYRIRKNDFLTR